MPPSFTYLAGEFPWILVDPFDGNAFNPYHLRHLFEVAEEVKNRGQLAATDHCNGELSQSVVFFSRFGI